MTLMATFPAHKLIINTLVHDIPMLYFYMIKLYMIHHYLVLLHIYFTYLHIYCYFTYIFTYISVQIQQYVDMFMQIKPYNNNDNNYIIYMILINESNIYITKNGGENPL